MFYVLMRWRGPHGAWPVLAVGISVVFTVSGLELGIATYPHYEVLAPGLAVLALALLVERRLLPAWMVGVVALAVREDIGFHIVAILGLFLVVEFVRTGSVGSQRHVLVFAAACFAYSIAAIVCQQLFFATTDTFRLVYAGNDWFGHLSGELIQRRLVFIFEHRIFVWLPLALTLVAATALRNVYVAIGALAYLPWLALHFSAFRDAAGTLSVHYPFPLVAGVGWVAICLALPGRNGSPGRICWPVTWLIAIIASTYVANPAVLAFFVNAEPRGFAASPGRTIEFANALDDSVPLLGKVKVDAGVMSLAPASLPSTAWLWPQDWNHQKAEADADIVIYFLNGVEASKVAAQIDAMKAVIRYTVPGTNIRIAAAKPVSSKAPIFRLMREQP